MLLCVLAGSLCIRCGAVVAVDVVAGIINCPELIFSLRAPHCEIYERCHRPRVFTINNLAAFLNDTIFTVYPQFLWKLCQPCPLLAASVLAMNGRAECQGPASTGIHYGVISHAARYDVDIGVPCTL